ncbi:NAD(P)/FAD-dependent oxidoreductase [bacterium]|nr:NAD(P)/FAD-dependent oxidoreductase [bacterium]
MEKKIAVIGGGAAGYFAAIRAKELHPQCSVSILEASQKTLAKVRISGGGRCNVTNAGFDARRLSEFYPRGARELRGAFSRFAMEDTVEWFRKRGVPLKEEGDKRMFPVSNSSETVVRCLKEAASTAGVETLLNHKVIGLEQRGGVLVLSLRGKKDQRCDRVVFATGGIRSQAELFMNLGHTVVALAPSLFTFQITHPLLEGLSGVSFPRAVLTLMSSKDAQGKPYRMKRRGPLLITHWGVSGPAVIQLSAFAARELYRDNYSAVLRVQFDEALDHTQCIEALLALKQNHPKRLVRENPFSSYPKSLWEKVLSFCEIPERSRYAECSHKELKRVARCLTEVELPVSGKGVFKEEFVTCGGISLAEIDFRTMKSKILPSISFAGEVLDIDGITGGFNFQAAWTTGYIAGDNIIN